jgi:hypothetical protein
VHPAHLSGNATYVYDVGQVNSKLQPLRVIVALFSAPVPIESLTVYLPFRGNQSLLQRPLNAAARKKLLQSVSKKHFRDLVLTPPQLIDHNYPDAKEGDKDEGWFTLDRPGEDPARMFAIDCEMVVTDRGRELARCTIVDEAYTTL